MKLKYISKKFLADSYKNIFKKNEDLYSKILLWANNKQESGFSWDELISTFHLTPSQEKWAKKIFLTTSDNDRKFIEHLKNDETSTSNIHYYALNEKGISAALSYRQGLETSKSSLHANIFSGVAIILAFGALVTSIWTGNLTQKSLEISAEPHLEITTNNEQQDIVTRTAGWIEADNSKLYLKLQNSSLPALSDIDIRMTLWFIDRSTTLEGRFKWCPIGYVSHENNPEFAIADIKTNNILNSKFTLRSGEAYPLSFNYEKLSYIDAWGEKLSGNSAVFLRIDVDYTKQITQSKGHYTKIYRIFNTDTVVDIDLNPSSGYMVGNKKIKTRLNQYNLPSIFYPFENNDFTNYIKSLPIPDSLVFSECDEFDVIKEIKQFSY